MEASRWRPQDGGLKMEAARWRSQDGGLKMEASKWRSQDGGLKMEASRWRPQNGGLEMEAGVVNLLSSKICFRPLLREVHPQTKKSVSLQPLGGYLISFKCLPFSTCIYCWDVYISVYMLLGKSKWRRHTEKILKCQVWIEKKHFLDDYMFGSRQLKGLRLSQFILKYLHILPAKIDFEKSEAEQS